jgi:hypothetical protein
LLQSPRPRPEPVPNTSTVRGVRGRSFPAQLVAEYRLASRFAPLSERDVCRPRPGAGFLRRGRWGLLDPRRW